MQGIFQKENTDKALKYGIYRHLPTYEKIIRNLVSFFNTKAVGHEKPVVTGVSGAYGATGYSKPSVTVSSWSANKMKFKGTCKLTAGGTYTMTGTKTISLP
ncbi:MAG: hypothetical protein ACLTAB_09060 [Anaerostipes hadrus]